MACECHKLSLQLQQQGCSKKQVLGAFGRCGLINEANRESSDEPTYESSSRHEGSEPGADIQRDIFVKTHPERIRNSAA
jgi:hypothetical protein